MPCSCHTDEELDECNAVDAFIEADDSCDDDKRTKALEFICQNFEDVVQQDDFKDCLSCEQVDEIITSPQLVANTKLIFEAVMAWAESADAACERTLDQVESLLKKIPFAIADPDDMQTYFCNKTVTGCQKLSKIMCDLWKDAYLQRPKPCKPDDLTTNNVWYGDITLALTRPIVSKDQIFYFVRQGYVFQLMVTTHKGFAKSGKGLDVFVRVLRAETGWKHSKKPLRKLHVKATLWVYAGNKEHCLKRKTFSTDLMKDEDCALYGVEGLVSCADLCKIVNSKEILVGVRLDIEKVCTVGASKKKDKENKKSSKCDRCCMKKTCDCCCVASDSSTEGSCECCPPKNGEECNKLLCCQFDCCGSEKDDHEKKGKSSIKCSKPPEKVMESKSTQCCEHCCC